jgi:hypothetical protein
MASNEGVREEILHAVVLLSENKEPFFRINSTSYPKPSGTMGRDDFPAVFHTGNLQVTIAH